MATDDEAIVVTGYQPEVPVTSAKTDIPMIETPQAISVVTQDLMKAQGITRLADALRNVAGVSRSSTYGYYDAYQIRGFDAAYGSIYLDGLLASNSNGAVNELGGLEQVEVVKGPASMLFGASPLGGIVNMVSKRPKNDRFLEVGAATGSYNLIETTLDGNMPLIGDALLGRINVVYRDSDDFVDYAKKERIYVAPSLTWNIANSTSLTVLGRYERDHDSPWSPTVAWGTVLPSAYGKLPIDFSINNPADHPDHAINNQTYKQIGYIFEHAFTDDLKFTQTMRYEKRDFFWDNWVFADNFLDHQVVNGVQQGHILGRFVYGPFDETDKEIAVDSRVSWDVQTGPISHGFVAGVDYRHDKSDYASGGDNFNGADNAIDILNLNYSAPLIHDPANAYTDGGKSEQTGFYLQDHVKVGNQFTLTLGGRWDEAKAGGVTDHKFSPRVGATYAIVPGAALYASWSKSFTPTPAYNATVTGDPLPPETGKNIEAGLKVATPDGTLNGMISVFELTRQNVATADPQNPFFFVVTGEQRSRGIEIEGMWTPIDGATLGIAYAYLDAKVTKDNVFPVGARLPNVPMHALNVYAEYEVQSGALQNLGFNANVEYNGHKNASLYPEDVDFDGAPDSYSLFSVPSYTILDLGLSYRFKDWIARLNVNNVTDKRYFPDACCLTRVSPGEPRSWRVALSRTF